MMKRPLWPLRLTGHCVCTLFETLKSGMTLRDEEGDFLVLLMQSCDFISVCVCACARVCAMLAKGRSNNPTLIFFIHCIKCAQRFKHCSPVWSLPPATAYGTAPYIESGSRVFFFFFKQLCSIRSFPLFLHTIWFPASTTVHQNHTSDLQDPDKLSATYVIAVG